MVSGKYNRVKGHTFEREVAAALRVAMKDPAIKRSIQYRGGASDGADVIAGPFHIECKRQKKPRIGAAYEQACKDCPEGGYPMAVTKANRSEALATLALVDFLDLLTELWELREAK